MASAHAAISTPPAPPNKWPVIDLVELIETLEACWPKTFLIARVSQTSPMSVEVARSGSPFGLVVACTERFHGRKSGETNRDNRGLRSAGEENIGIAKFDHSPGFADRVI